MLVDTVLGRRHGVVQLHGVVPKASLGTAMQRPATNTARSSRLDPTHHLQHGEIFTVGGHAAFDAYAILGRPEHLAVALTWLLLPYWKHQASGSTRATAEGRLVHHQGCPGLFSSC